MGHLPTKVLAGLKRYARRVIIGAKDGWRAGSVPEHRDARLGRSAHLGDGERVAGGE